MRKLSWLVVLPAFFLCALSAADDAKAGPAPAAPTKLDAERAKALKENLKDFNLTLQYQGPAPGAAEKPYYALQIFTNPAVWRKVPEGLLLAQVDEETAGKLVDCLAASGVLGRAFEIISTHAAEPMGPPGRSYVFFAGRYQAFIVFGNELDAQLKALRANLKDDAAKQMDLLMARVAENEAAGVAAERAKALKDNLDNFALKLDFRGAQDKPLYRSLTLSTKALPRKHLSEMELEAVIDKETAAKIIDRLVEAGVLGKAHDPRLQVARRTTPGPYYVIDIFGGRTPLEGDLEWGKMLADHLLGLRARLTGDAAKQMDVLIDRLGGYWQEWTGKPYEPPK